MKRFEKQGDRWEEISLMKNEVRARGYEGDVLNALAVIYRAIVRSSFMVFAATHTK